MITQRCWMGSWRSSDMSIRSPIASLSHRSRNGRDPGHHDERGFPRDRTRRAPDEQERGALVVRLVPLLGPADGAHRIVPDGRRGKQFETQIHTLVIVLNLQA